MSKMTKTLSQQAFDLRESGLSWMEIGRQMNLSASFVRHLAVYNENLQQRPAVWTEGLKPTHGAALRNAGFSSKREVLLVLDQEPSLLLSHVGIDKRALEKIRAWAQPDEAISAATAAE